MKCCLAYFDILSIIFFYIKNVLLLIQSFFNFPILDEVFFCNTLYLCFSQSNKFLYLIQLIFCSITEVTISLIFVVLIDACSMCFFFFCKCYIIYDVLSERSFSPFPYMVIHLARLLSIKHLDFCILVYKFIHFRPQPLVFSVHMAASIPAM